MEAQATPMAGWNWEHLLATSGREARRWLRGPDAEDVVQEALARAWRQRASCRGAADPTPWVRQITRMEAFRLMERRRQLAERERVDPDPEPGEAISPCEEVHDRVDVRRALGMLSEPDRALVHARYVLDLTQPAAACAVGVPEGTAKVRLHRIRGRLREALEAPGR
jgi:RNA polymerase sigma-70 factor (ECF subfamily)